MDPSRVVYGVQRYEELVKLKNYLQYKICLREFEESIAVVNGNVEELRKQYVEKQLHQFDIDAKILPKILVVGPVPCFLHI